MYLLPLLLRCLLALFGLDLPHDLLRAGCEIAPPMNEPSRHGLPVPERASARPAEVAPRSPPRR